MNTESDVGVRRVGDERGASFVEFALIFPIFMTILLGMFSGGQSYNRKISMSNAAGEASRYGATLAPSTQEASPSAGCTVVPPPSGLTCGLDQWVNTVADAVVQNASGDLDANVTGRYICVAYVHPALDTTGPHGQQSHRAVYAGAGAPVEDSGATARCFNDGRGDDEKRVQILVRRKSPIEALFFNADVTLTARSVTRFEAESY